MASLGVRIGPKEFFLLEHQLNMSPSSPRGEVPAIRTFFPDAWISAAAPAAAVGVAAALEDAAAPRVPAPTVDSGATGAPPAVTSEGLEGVSPSARA